MTAINRRQLLTGGAGLALTLGLPSLVRAQTDTVFRIGVVSPANSGNAARQASVAKFIGDAARWGALMAEGPVAEQAAADGVRLVLGMANAPTADAAARAGGRFVTAGIDAIVGGVGDGQADVLSRIAEDAGIPFLNIGDASSALRHDCRRHTFHVSPSAAMYLDAMAMWGAELGHQRWFIVHEDNAAGAEFAQRAVGAITRLGPEAATVDAIGAAPGASFYGPQLFAAEEARADVIVLLLDYLDQLAFIGQQESLQVTIPVLPFPEPNAQTRAYISSFAAIEMTTSPDHRFSMWDASLSAGAAGDFNNRYLTRWGEAADPQAWSAYHAIKILAEAVRDTGTTQADALVDYLENSGTEYDLLKGPGVSFRPWDHQLRQPLYVVRVNHESEWEFNVPTTHVAVADVERELPGSDAGDGDPIARLDALGDDARTANCFIHDGDSEH